MIEASVGGSTHRIRSADISVKRMPAMGVLFTCLLKKQTEYGRSIGMNSQEGKELHEIAKNLERIQKNLRDIHQDLVAIWGRMEPSQAEKQADKWEVKKYESCWDVKYFANDIEYLPHPGNSETIYYVEKRSPDKKYEYTVARWSNELKEYVYLGYSNEFGGAIYVL